MEDSAHDVQILETKRQAGREAQNPPQTPHGCDVPKPPLGFQSRSDRDCVRESTPRARFGISGGYDPWTGIPTQEVDEEMLAAMTALISTSTTTARSELREKTENQRRRGSFCGLSSNLNCKNLSLKCHAFAFWGGARTVAQKVHPKGQLKLFQYWGVFKFSPLFEILVHKKTSDLLEFPAMARDGSGHFRCRQE